MKHTTRTLLFAWIVHCNGMAGLLANAQQPTLQETRDDLFGLLGIVPNMKKKGDDGGKGMGMVGTGKRAWTEESPEDLFGLLGIFPNKKG
jgi:hypothetical protein